MIKTVVFDLGGVCLHETAWSEILSKKYNIPKDEIHKLLDEEYRKLATSSEKSDEFWKNIKSRYKLKDDWKNIRNSIIDSITTNNKVLEIIKKLKKNGYEVLYFSNSHIDLSAGINDKCGIESFFDNGLFSHNSEFFKPDKRFYYELLKISKSKLDEMVFIDNKEVNLVTARELGMSTILFSDKTNLKKELSELGIKV